MRFPVSVVRTFREVQTNFQYISNRFLDSGTVTLSFSGSTNSGNVTVPHTLGRVPTAVVVTSYTAPAFGNMPTCNAFNYTKSSFDINAELKSSYTGGITVSWVAT